MASYDIVKKSSSNHHLLSTFLPYGVSMMCGATREVEKRDIMPPVFFLFAVSSSLLWSRTTFPPPGPTLPRMRTQLHADVGA